MLGGLGAALRWLVLLPVVIVAVLFAVANDQLVTVRLNPFDSADEQLAASLPLYQIAFAVFVIGALCGGLVVWNKQRKFRRQARLQRGEAARWQARAERAEGGPVRGAGLLHGPGA
ncbi:MAG: LapA family protein [Caulobacterales bacterium]|nr:LapA family protein [Caulobacterales bacterium]